MNDESILNKGADFLLEELVRDLCSVEYRSKSKTRELIVKYTEALLNRIPCDERSLSECDCYAVDTLKEIEAFKEKEFSQLKK